MKTWHVEALVVFAVLVIAAFGAGGGWVEWLGVAAVQFTWHHAAIADRLQERQTSRPTVECHRQMWRFWVAKEALWLVYFVAHESYAALAGVGVFLAYPLWRRWWRARHPLREATA